MDATREVASRVPGDDDAPRASSSPLNDEVNALKAPHEKPLSIEPGQMEKVLKGSAVTSSDVTKLMGLFSEWQEKLKNQGSDKVGYELLYSFLQYSKVKKVQALHELRSQIQSLDEDLSTVCNRLQASTGVVLKTESGKLNMKNAEFLQKKIFSNPRNKSLIQMFPNLETLYSYKPSSGIKRKSGSQDAVLEGSVQASKRAQYVDHLAKTLSTISNYQKLRLEVDIPSGDGAMLQRPSIISSIGYNPAQDYFATAGVSRKIKIYDCKTVLNDKYRVPCPMIELTWRSKLSGLDWNAHDHNVLATSDYDGMISVWDVDSGENILEYDEHEKRAWSVCFNKIENHLLASGSDDGTVKIYSTKAVRSVLSIDTFANVCSVQFHPSNFHYVAVGCADHNAYIYDLRNAQTPVLKFSGHKRAISYVSYSKNNELLTVSTDNTLRLWDVCDGTTRRILSGHTNQKHFVGLAIQNDWIACGSETNELYIYHSSLEKPLFSYCFNSDSINQTAEERHSSQNQFISATCWKSGSDTIISASSDGNLRILRMCANDAI